MIVHACRISVRWLQELRYGSGCVLGVSSSPPPSHHVSRAPSSSPLSHTARMGQDWKSSISSTAINP